MDTRTTTQLLEALSDPRNRTMWGAFDERYRPIIIAFAIRRGLSHADAEEAAQATLSDFASVFQRGGYDRSRGRLRAWLIGIALNRIASLKRDNASSRHGIGNPIVEPIVDPLQEDETQWTDAVRRTVLERAIGLLRERSRLDDRTIAAFELTALRGMPPAAAAAVCGMSTNEVYVAKNRVIRKLRDITASIMQELDCA